MTLNKKRTNCRSYEDNVIITFEKIRYKNLLSAGNQWIEVDLSARATTLIIGENGAGKSTMLDALSFALFGKPHRNINKPMLINSINQRECEAEVEFTVHNSKYKIVRGMKPTRFEIWRDGERVNQDSNSADDQKMVESTILGMNHKTFHQVVVLGSSTFTPFLQLSTAQRRVVIEQLLDISIFGSMNQVVKHHISDLKRQYQEQTVHNNALRDAIKSEQRHRENLASIVAQNEDAIQQQVDHHNDEIAKLRAANQAINEQYGGDLQESVLIALDERIKHCDKISSLVLKLQSQRSTLAKERTVFEREGPCPTCHQVMDHETREAKLGEISNRIPEIETALEQLVSKQRKAQQDVGDLRTQLDQITAHLKEIDVNNLQIDSHQQSISKLQTNKGGSHDQELKTIDATIARKSGELVKCMEQVNDTFTTMQYYDVIQELLKDTGIKAKVIDQYLPVINQQVNKYLQALDLFVDFELDNVFTDTIRARHRDEMSYPSFSEGEKTRIDVALLFAWREVARLKNSISTNLLILDETFDASLDGAGVDNLLDVLYDTRQSTNVFVISHKARLQDRFDATMQFTKPSLFSSYTILENNESN